jgi:hypothetical protein
MADFGEDEIIRLEDSHLYDMKLSQHFGLLPALGADLTSREAEEQETY